MPDLPSVRRPQLLAVLLVGAVAAWLAFASSSPLPADLHDFARGIAIGMLIGLLLMGLVRAVPPLREWAVRASCDNAVPALRRRYLREFLPAMFGYVLALSLSLWLLHRVHEPILRAMVALLPVLPIMLAVRAIMRYIRDADELQRQIELEAVSMATALVSLLYMAGGFLQLAKVIDVPAGVAMIWVFPLVCLVYGLAKIAVMRRFR